MQSTQCKSEVRACNSVICMQHDTHDAFLIVGTVTLEIPTQHEIRIRS